MPPSIRRSRRRLMVDLSTNPQVDSPVASPARETSRDRLVAIGGRGLVAALLLAPWAFGSRPYWAALALAGGLSLAVAAWLAGCLRERRPPRVPFACAGAALFLAAFAACGLLNPRAVFDPTRARFLTDPSSVGFLPGTVDAATGWTFTLEMLAYLGVVPMVADLARAASWRQKFLDAVAWTGTLVAVAGLFLKLGGWPHLAGHLQQRPWAQGGEIFGPFDYHGNAGAFLNLALPAVAWKAATAEAPALRGLWRGALGVLYVALFANSSRAALLIGLCLAPLCLLILRRWPGSTGSAPREPRALPWILGFGGPAALLVAGVCLVNHDIHPLGRLRHLAAELRQPEYPRLMQSRAAWQLARDRPVLGAGVGTYKVLVQTSSIRGYFFAPSYRPGAPFSVLANAHEDYLQTLVEWGWVGLAGWAVLVGGAFARLGRWLWQTRFSTRTGLAIGVALASLYLHALGDCPLQIPALQCYAAVYLGLAWASPDVRLRPAN